MSDHWLEDSFSESLLTFHNTIGARRRTFVQRVRLFEAEELVIPCTAAGFEVDVALGDNASGALIADSPRIILFARRQ